MKKFKECDIKKCEAVCCYDGAYLTNEDEDKIHRAVKENPDFFKTLPTEYITDGNWENTVTGRKTAVKDHQYKNEIAPHFNQTRCVFTDDKGLCLLQSLAILQNLHPWSYKPMTCWMFPLDKDKDGNLIPPPSRENDPCNISDDYPGFTSFTPCGSHNPKGKHWQKALKKEIAYAKQSLKLNITN